MKRVFDIWLSTIGLLVLAPLLALLCVAIRLCDGAPVFFHQERVGRHGRPFRIHKFRTMSARTDKHEKQLTIGGDPRITRLGHWLRHTKLDELPQLFNVLKGQMSFVGPRPEVPRYVAKYTVEQRRVLEVLPGITDAASIRFFNESELLRGRPDPEKTYLDEIVPEKIRLNLEYAAKATVLRDFGILLQTFTRMCRV